MLRPCKGVFWACCMPCCELTGTKWGHECEAHREKFEFGFRFHAHAILLPAEPTPFYTCDIEHSRSWYWHFLFSRPSRLSHLICLNQQKCLCYTSYCLTWPKDVKQHLLIGHCSHAHLLCPLNAMCFVLMQTSNTLFSKPTSPQGTYVLYRAL